MIHLFYFDTPTKKASWPSQLANLVAGATLRGFPNGRQPSPFPTELPLLGRNKPFGPHTLFEPARVTLWKPLLRSDPAMLSTRCKVRAKSARTEPLAFSRQTPRTATDG